MSAAKDGLLALSVGTELGVMHERLECEVTETVGPKAATTPIARQWATANEGGEVTLGGRRVGMERPRVRTADGTGDGAPAT